MNKTIGKKLLELRKQKNLSQEQVADMLCISQSAYGRIETGESNSWANHLNKLCSIFEIQPEELVKSDGMIINHNQQGGGGYIQVVNQLSEKLIEQYEARLREKDAVIALLKGDK